MCVRFSAPSKLQVFDNFRIYQRGKEFLKTPTMSVLKHWNTLLMEVVESPSVKTVKTPDRHSSGQPTLGDHA